MTWTQLTNPLHRLGLSALVAASPIAFIFWALIIRKMKGHTVSLLTVLAGAFIAITVYGMPVKLAALSVIDGALYGLFTICWIILGNWQRFLLSTAPCMACSPSAGSFWEFSSFII